MPYALRMFQYLPNFLLSLKKFLNSWLQLCTHFAPPLMNWIGMRISAFITSLWTAVGGFIVSLPPGLKFQTPGNNCLAASDLQAK